MRYELNIVEVPKIRQKKKFAIFPANMLSGGTDLPIRTFPIRG